MSDIPSTQLTDTGATIPPFTKFTTRAAYDFVTDPNLVAKVVGFRRGLGYTVVMVYEQPEVEANYVTGFAANGSMTKTSLPIPPQTKSWTIVSHT